MIKIINDHIEICGIKYVDVETEHGKHTMLESRVKLLNALYATGLNELGVNAIMELVNDLTMDLQDESELD